MISWRTLSRSLRLVQNTWVMQDSIYPGRMLILSELTCPYNTRIYAPEKFWKTANNLAKMAWTRALEEPWRAITGWVACCRLSTPMTRQMFRGSGVRHRPSSVRKDEDSEGMPRRHEAAHT